MMIPL